MTDFNGLTTVEDFEELREASAALAASVASAARTAAAFDNPRYTRSAPRRTSRSNFGQPPPGRPVGGGMRGNGLVGVAEKCACEKAKDVFRSIMDKVEATGDVKGAKKELKHVQRDLRLTKQFVKAL